MRPPTLWLIALITLTVTAEIPAAYAVPSVPTPDSKFPLVVHVINKDGQLDIIRFADHTDSPTEGNWVTLGGGTDVTLPQVTMRYSGVEQATYTRGSNQITLETYNLDGRVVQYPATTHQTYTSDQTITYTFRGSDAHKDKTVSVRVIPVTPTSLRDAASDAFMGDTAALKALLSSGVAYTETMDANGDLISKSIGTLSPGDYALLIVDENIGNPYTLDVYSATAIEVLDYQSTVTLPTSVTRGNDLEVKVKLTGADATSRRYGAVIIQESKYSAELALTSDGTTEGTALTCRGAALITGTADSFSLTGVGVEGIDTDLLLEKLEEAYSGSEFSAAFTGYTTATLGTVELTTTGLNTGEYVVLVGAWEGATGKLAAFSQRKVTVSSPIIPIPTPTPTPTPTTLSLIQAMGDAEAAAALSAMEPADAAGIMNQLTAQKAAAVMAMMTTADAAAILNEMHADAAAALMEEADSGTAARVLAAADPSKAAEVMAGMTAEKAAQGLEAAVAAGEAAQLSVAMNALNQTKAAEILLETPPQAAARIVEAMAGDDLTEAAKRVEEAVKLRLAEEDPERARQMLTRIAAILDEADTGALVSIFIEIAGLPETPSTVASVMEAMDESKVTEVISAWVTTGSLDELAQVLSLLSEDRLGQAWRGITLEERGALFTHLTPETALLLPELGEFQVTGLAVTPEAAEPGQSVIVTVQVTNVGPEPGPYTLTLRVNGAQEATGRVALTQGQTRTVEWTITREGEGEYGVDVNGLTASFTVQAPPVPPAFTFSFLTVNPATVEPGSPVTVTVTARNTGGLKGSTSVELKVNGATENARTVTLDPGASETVSFTVTRSTQGAYTLTVGSLTGGFTVSGPPPPAVPWAAVLAAAVVVTAVGYAIYERRGPRGPA